ncbi:MAG: rhomboid family intramembrane serine protease [Saprospiraceae bacterium]|nr:rhomboid family intramembrane serine protease [Saprospiraceae bacterium]
MAVFGSIWEDIKYSFRMGNMVTRLAIVNFGVFVAVNLVKLTLWIANGGYGIPDYFDDGLYFFCMPAQWQTALFHPWGFFTSMFLHEDFWHVVNNLIFLYLFGTIAGDLIGNRRVFPIYLMGGLVGNVLFLLSDFWMHYPIPYALGASGAVMALAGAVLILAPDYRVMLILLGQIKLKYIVLVMVLLDMVGIAHNSNSGGHIAHLGGFAMGVFFVYQLRDGKDLAVPFNNLFDRIMGWFSASKRKPSPPPRRPQPAMKTTFGNAKGNRASDTNDLSFQEKLDAILDKIKQQGYENLTTEEKDFLYEASKK